MTRGEKVIAFIERFCPVPEGKLVGKPMRLDDFQKRFILEVYDNPAGTTEGILSIARKNGKSGLIAGIMLAHIAGPEARLNSQIVSGARSRDQAALVFGLASKMVNLSPDLCRLVRIVPSGKRLIGLAKNVEYRALAADGQTAHGLSPVVAIFDEMGQVRGPQDDFVEAIETAQGAYDDALKLIISTQAPTDGDMLSIRIDDAVRSRDPKIVCHVYAGEPDCDVLDPVAHAAANPALGTFRSAVELQQAAEKAARMPSFENSFRNLYLNQRVNRFSPFISPGVWADGTDEVDEQAFLTGPVYGGLDLAETTDLCAFVLIARGADGRWNVKAWFWKPERTLVDHAKRDRVPYDVWVKRGLIETTPGVAVDYEFVAVKIAQICAGLNIAKLGFDRYRFKTLEAQLQKLGVVLPFEPFGQGHVSMAPAMDVTEIAFLNKQMRHGAHPVMTMCAANAVVEKNAAGDRKLNKAKSTGRIDGMVALVMAMGMVALDEPAKQPSVYARRGVLRI
ncbi:terminase large subunit [Sphingomonas montanisoli]|uniref:Terminase large subunit n=1 Tax=Sphingomonas montanisoli TaxID=2606412 RepID=A0A5D9C4J4_9SPHN|nr:terminase TerL endonuclease subunit [Sphingomonas montanisoli]TZG24875.1 terminase large subunit [Sphingomonas montanisoli]